MTVQRCDDRLVRSWRACVVVVLSLALATPVVSSRLGGIMYWLLFIMGLASLSSRLAPTRPARSLLADKVFWWICWAPLVLNLLSVVFNRTAMREVVLVPLLAMPALVVLLERVRPDLRAVVAGSLVATLLALAVSAWGALYLGVKRPGPPGMNQIIFGQLTVLATVVCACAWRSREPGIASLARIAGPIGVTAGIAAIFLASFLGGLLALPVVVAALLRSAGGRAAGGVYRQGRLLALVLVALAALASLPPIIDRVQDMSAQVDQWRGGRVDKSSAGTRIELAKAAVAIIAEHPWFGLGAGRFREGLMELRTAGRFPDDVQLMRHAHNTYLNALVEYGLVGFIVLGSAVLLLGRQFLAGIGLGASIGMSALAAWMLLGLTNDIFAHQATLRAMALLFTICLVAIADRRPSVQTARS